MCLSEGGSGYETAHVGDGDGSATAGWSSTPSQRGGRLRWGRLPRRGWWVPRRSFGVGRVARRSLGVERRVARRHTGLHRRRRWLVGRAWVVGTGLVGRAWVVGTGLVGSSQSYLYLPVRGDPTTPNGLHPARARASTAVLLVLLPEFSRVLPVREGVPWWMDAGGAAAACPEQVAVRKESPLTGGSATPTFSFPKTRTVWSRRTFGNRISYSQPLMVMMQAARVRYSGDPPLVCQLHDRPVFHSLNRS
jgi:hypothetical protein